MALELVLLVLGTWWIPCVGWVEPWWIPCVLPTLYYFGFNYERKENVLENHFCVVKQNWLYAKETLSLPLTYPKHVFPLYISTPSLVQLASTFHVLTCYVSCADDE